MTLLPTTLLANTSMNLPATASMPVPEPKSSGSIPLAQSMIKVSQAKKPEAPKNLVEKFVEIQKEIQKFEIFRVLSVIAALAGAILFKGAVISAFCASPPGLALCIVIGGLFGTLAAMGAHKPYSDDCKPFAFIPLGAGTATILGGFGPIGLGIIAASGALIGLGYAGYSICNENLANLTHKCRHPL